MLEIRGLEIRLDEEETGMERNGIDDRLNGQSQLQIHKQEPRNLKIRQTEKKERDLSQQQEERKTNRKALGSYDFNTAGIK
ncbi:hypothetical protein OXYTRIMIC_099 [Oxytricha trifallax]|uniref:Uncharacterized protein n=1 Tax=Oxytricha trifallax TaxID=1172189 RepID=A0A073HZK1_9SPIT|nr:hypothetical protein OXYTRIMIC_099 [Oxytricha trifallax]